MGSRDQLRWNIKSHSIRSLLIIILLGWDEGFGHVPQPREFTIDDQSSSEHRSQTATGCFRPLMPLEDSKPTPNKEKKTNRSSSFFLAGETGFERQV